MSSMMDLLGGGAPAGAAGPPASIPDPEPHLAPGGAPGGGGDQAGQLAALLAGGDGGAGDPDAAADASGVPDNDADDPSAGGSTHQGNEVQTLKSLLGMAHDYMSIPTVEPKEAHKMAKAVTIITDLLAGNQEMHDQVSGSNPAVRKAIGPVG